MPSVSTRIPANREIGRKRFLQPDMIGLIPTGEYTSNTNYSKKAMMWLLHVELTAGVKIMLGSNGREYNVPELPHCSVDGYCPEARTIYEFFGCYFHGQTCQPFRDVINTSGDSLAERYERTMSRLEQITRSGYLVKAQCDFEFDESVVVKQKPELITHPIVQQSPQRTRDALYGGRTETICLYHKARENETI